MKLSSRKKKNQTARNPSTPLRKSSKRNQNIIWQKEHNKSKLIEINYSSMQHSMKKILICPIWLPAINPRKHKNRLFSWRSPNWTEPLRIHLSNRSSTKSPQTKPDSKPTQIKKIPVNLSSPKWTSKTQNQGKFSIKPPHRFHSKQCSINL